MAHTTTRRPVDLAPPRDLSVPALVLAVLSVPGSIVTWGWLPGGGFAWGLPPALLAVALGAAQLKPLAHRSDPRPRGHRDRCRDDPDDGRVDHRRSRLRTPAMSVRSGAVRRVALCTTRRAWD